MTLSEGWSLLGGRAGEGADGAERAGERPGAAEREAAGERQAIAEVGALVGEHGALLFRVAHSVLRSRQEAEDVVQDVFVRVLRRREGLDGIADVRVWLVRIAWNLSLDRRRRLRPEQMEEGFVEGLAARSVPADRQMEERQEIAHVLRTMERLPRAEREALLLSAVDELRTTEMAAVLGRSESAVRALLHRARTRLRERLEQEERR